MKRILLALLLALTGAAAHAYDFKVGGIYYNILSDGVSVAVTTRGIGITNSYEGVENINIPSSVTLRNTYAVTEIESMAFYECTSLKSVTIPNSVKTIGMGAFQYCTSLTSVTIPNSVTTIGNDNSYSSSLTSLITPSALISYGAFYGCTGLTSVVFNAENCTTMGYESYPVFAGCSNLVSLTIGESVKTIPQYAFKGCSSLTGTLTIPNSVTSIGTSAFEGCSSLTGTLTIPNSVTSIGTSAFEGCSGLTSIVFNAENCTTIGSADAPAFAGCSNLVSLTIGESVNTIPECAFNGCSSITSVNFDAKNCTSTGNSFNGWTNIKTLTIGGKVQSIPDNAFEGCSSLRSIAVPHSVTHIGTKAFNGCSGLTEVTLGKSVETIMADAFAGNKVLNKVISLNTTPPSCTDAVFNEVNKEKCKLYVPIGCKDIYAGTYMWWDFTNIIETDYSGVNDAATDTMAISTADGLISIAGLDAEMQIFDLSGKLVWQGAASQGARLSHGIYLVRVAGSVSKVAL